MQKAIMVGILGCAALFSLGMAGRSDSTPQVRQTETVEQPKPSLPDDGNEKPEQRICQKFGIVQCPGGPGFEYSPGCPSCADYGSASTARTACEAACTPSCNDSGLIYDCF